MTYGLRVKRRAQSELAEGVEWYEKKQKGLGLRFLNHIEHYFHMIQNNPTIYEMRRKPFREAFVDKFPYLIIYSIENDMIIISAVFNVYQHPDKKFGEIE